MAHIQIAIADDHQIVRDGIVLLLREEPDLTIVFQAKNGKEMAHYCEDHEVDLIVMDITMPEMDGIEATRIIKEKHPEIKILALTMLKEDEHIRKMIKAGASGYILKNSGQDELLQAIRTIMDGQHYFSNDATQAILKELVNPVVSKNQESPDVHITEREREVLKLIVNELTNQEIAEKLFVSVRTVDAHRRNLLQKTGAKNTAGLVKYAYENKVFENQD